MRKVLVLCGIISFLLMSCSVPRENIHNEFVQLLNDSICTYINESEPSVALEKLLERNNVESNVLICPNWNNEIFDLGSKLNYWDLDTSNANGYRIMLKPSSDFIELLINLKTKGLFPKKYADNVLATFDIGPSSILLLEDSIQTLNFNNEEVQLALMLHFVIICNQGRGKSSLERQF